eukprot:CFRG5415T1
MNVLKLRSVCGSSMRVECRRFSHVARRSLQVSAQGVVRTSLLRSGRYTPIYCGNLKSTRTFRTSAAHWKTISFNLADIGEGIAEAEVLQWFVDVGDEVEEFDPICEVQSDKATVEITSRYPGKISKRHYELGEMAVVHAPLVDIEQADGAESSVKEDKPSKLTPTPASGPPDTSTTAPTPRQEPDNFVEVSKNLATPAVRRIARENDIDLRTVPASGKDGRVLKGDILAFLENGGVTSAPATSMSTSEPMPSSSPSTIRPPASSTPRADTMIQVKGIQRAMVKSMLAANAVPHFTYGEELLMNKLIELRNELKPAVAASGISLSYLPFILKAISLALNDFPMINAHADEDASEITYKGSHNIRVAMDTPQGLLVPCVKNVQDLSVVEIASELNRLQVAGAAGKLSTEDMAGGTISFSNIGAIGGTYMRPVLVTPEVAIAAMGKIMSVPRFDNNMQVYNAQIANISWSGDHRVLDGATMAKFSNVIKSYIEEPQRMFLHMK